MKQMIAILLGAALVAVPLASAQQTLPAQPGTARTPGKPLAEQWQLTKFDLDFPGGTPKELLKAIEKGLGKPVNAIVPDECPDFKLPALKMHSVDLQQLFQALESVSAKSMTVMRGGMPTYQTSTSFGFRTKGVPSDDAIWYFFYGGPSVPEEPKVCRLYQLGPYLENYTIDDITTAIQTGWKMLMEIEPPTISFHKDTKLLIAVGEQHKLALIDSVLQELLPAKAMPPRPPAAAPQPDTKPRPPTKP